jgi:hypothetical protein
MLSLQAVRLSTSPMSPATHWQQSVFYMGATQALRQDTIVQGTFQLAPTKDNHRFLDVEIAAKLGQLSTNYTVLKYVLNDKSFD